VEIHADDDRPRQVFEPSDTEFDHPKDVVGHPEFSLAEKRAILPSWAFDARRNSFMSASRAPEGLNGPVSIDEIIEALQALDGGPRYPPGGKPNWLLRSRAWLHQEPP
jgi:hypothetical protein